MRALFKRLSLTFVATSLLTFPSAPAWAEPDPQVACSDIQTALAAVQAQAELDPLLTDIDSHKDQYKTCQLTRLRQLARIRVGRNEIIGSLRLVSHATTEADLAKWRDAAQTNLAQVEDAYVRLVGASEGGAVVLSCTPADPDAAAKGHAISRPEFPDPSNESVSALLKQPDPVTSGDAKTAQAQTCEARKFAVQAQATAHWRRLASTNLCGGFDADGDVRPYCVTYGVFASAISLIQFLDGAPAGIRSGRLLSVLVPYAGLRFIPFNKHPYISIDVNLYSAYITSGSIDTTPAATPCGGGTNALLRNLPCEANPKIQPYASVLAGLTVGQNNVGYLTLAPITWGYARVGSEGVHPYWGALAGTLQLTGKF